MRALLSFNLVIVWFILFSFVSEDEYNLNPGLEWEDEFTGRF